tara:strand:+ start:2091 stop:3878 length:1788 start_codon:yes stop_codon:yes gene_type:complete
MLGMEGLLTHLRIAIVNGDEQLASDIADLCSRQNNCNMRIFNSYVGRVCLEHKYPGDLKLFEVLKQRVNAARTNFNETNKTVRFVQVAVAAAKLPTSSVPFEKAFIAYHELLSTSKIQKECELDSNMTIEEYVKKIHVNDADLKFAKDDHRGVFEATLNTLSNDKFEVVKPSVTYDIEEDEISKNQYGMFDFSSDIVLKRTWIEKMAEDNEIFRNHDVYSEMSDYVIENYSTPIETRLVANEKINSWQKILSGDDASKKAKLLFPGTSDEFQERMSKYIEENKLFFMTKPTPLLAKLRVECRQFYATLLEVTIDDVKYGCRYLKKEKSHWVAQLVVPDDPPDPCSVASVISTYKRIHQKFTVSFPTFTKEDSQTLIYPEALFKCPWRKVVDVSIGEKTQRWIVAEHVHNMLQLKWKIDLTHATCCVSLLQLLVARYYFNVATTFKDIGVATVNGGDKVVVVKNYFGREHPNRKHRDIWHQLLHFTVKTTNYRKQRKRKNGETEMLEFKSSSEKNYYLNIIRLLKKYLTEHHTTDYKSSAFYKWGEKTYKLQFDLLYNRIIGSLGTEGDSNKRQRTGGVVPTVEQGINSSVNSRSI